MILLPGWGDAPAVGGMLACTPCSSSGDAGVHPVVLQQGAVMRPGAVTRSGITRGSATKLLTAMLAHRGCCPCFSAVLLCLIMCPNAFTLMLITFARS